MKIFIFVRGPESETKQRVVREILDQMPPDTVQWVSMSLYMTQDDKPNTRYADNQCKSVIKRNLASDTGPSILLIDNETLRPTDWSAYYALAEKKNINSIAIGIDVFSSEKNELTNLGRKTNLQYQNCALFISSVYKYLCIKTDEDIPGIITEISSFVRKVAGHDAE